MTKYILNFDEEKYNSLIETMKEVINILNENEFTEEEVYHRLHDNVKTARERFFKDEFAKTYKQFGLLPKDVVFGSETQQLIIKSTEARVKNKLDAYQKLYTFYYTGSLMGRWHFELYAKEYMQLKNGKWASMGNEPLKEFCTTYATNDKQIDIHKRLQKVVKVMNENNISKSDIWSYIDSEFERNGELKENTIKGKQLQREIN